MTSGGWESRRLRQDRGAITQHAKSKVHRNKGTAAGQLGTSDLSGIACRSHETRKG